MSQPTDVSADDVEAMLDGWLQGLDLLEHNPPVAAEVDEVGVAEEEVEMDDSDVAESDDEDNDVEAMLDDFVLGFGANDDENEGDEAEDVVESFSSSDEDDMVRPKQIQFMFK